ncbi:protein amalgam-like isoform X2 [Portunus trituberculatus]|nr:protein amalgam-like isoform X2 [Portunus trituberculatus]
MLTFVLVSALLLTVEGQSNGGTQASRPAARPPGPRLLTMAGRYHAHRGESVTLPCAVSNLGRRSVFWLKGDSLQSRELVMQIHGIRRRPVAMRQFLQDLRSGKLSTEGTNLIINKVSANDIGTYTCTVAWAGQSVTHVLEVTDTESAEKVVMEYFPPSKNTTVAEGSSVTFACRTPGVAQPSVTWYREGAESEVLQMGPVLQLEEAWRQDAGRYMCATSGEAEQQGTTFTLHVQYVSVKAAVERIEVRTEDRRARLTCYVEGYPEPQVSWYRNSGQISEGPRHRISAASGQYHLEIEQITTEDLGEYQCYVHNGVSRDLATVTLSAIPGQARVLEAKQTQPPKIYNVTWTVESVLPLRLYILEYGKEGMPSDQRNLTYIGVTTQPRGMTYVESGLLTLDPASTYELRVRGVTQDNQQGPDMTQPFILYTGGGTSAKVARMLRTSLPILSRLPALARNILQ